MSGMPVTVGDFSVRERDLGGSRRVAFAALWVVFGATSALFLTFAAAMMGRRAGSEDWAHTQLPALVWVNTGVLLASSAALERARGSLHGGKRAAFTRWWTAGLLLGALFLAGQAQVWRELAAVGLYVATNPSSGFIYILTAAHGAHVLGGMTALLYVAVQAHRLRLGPSKRTAADISAWFWHYLDALWLVLLVLLVRWA
jgi:cytochrome c oxidase subunit 3